MAKSGTQKEFDATLAFLEEIKKLSRETLRDKRIKQGARKGEELDRTPLAIATGAATPDTLTTALNRIMIASDPEGWERLHDYDFDGDEFEDTGDFESETDFVGNRQSTKKGHYDEPKKVKDAGNKGTDNFDNDGNTTQKAIKPSEKGENNE